MPRLHKARFNFDDALDMRRIAASRGYGSKEWIEFACFMYDHFEEIYETARKMTIHQDELWKEILVLREQLDNARTDESMVARHLSGRD